jgi:predicted MFS family arabinose efflux permease
MPTTRPVDPLAARWTMLSILSLGFFSLTLNWFDIAPAFPVIAHELDVGLPRLALLISVFLAGYGLAHIPGGLLATRIGMRATLVIGVLIEGIAGVLSGLARNYPVLVFCRVLAGVGGSIFIAVAFAAVTVWFEGRELTLALGISGGAAFSIGAAAGLYLWTFVQSALGWHVALVLGGVLGIGTAVVSAVGFRSPPGAATLRGVAVRGSAVRQVLLHRDLWVYGLALLGGYGAYFTASQLLAEYAVRSRGMSAGQAGLLAALIGLAGIPGSVFGGLLADRSRHIRRFVVAPLVLVALLLALVPVVPVAWLWMLGIGIGFFLIFGFAAWSSVPGRVAGVAHEHLGTAIGLMLTIAAVGGFLVPVGFGAVVERAGFPAGWAFLAAVSLAFALIGFAGRDTARSEPRHGATRISEDLRRSDR